MEPGAVDEPRFTGPRRALIETIRGRGVDSLEILQLFDRVPRHRFLPEALWPRAYEDAPLPIGFGQTASQPSLQAYTLQVLGPGPDDKVLEVGTGSGYQTALLALLANRVYSVDRVAELTTRARRSLDAQGIHNAALMTGDGTIGWRKFAPYDVIVVSAASPGVPPALEEQLAEGGRMLIPVGDRASQDLVLVRREEGRILQGPVGGRCAFVPLIGRFGWSSNPKENGE